MLKFSDQFTVTMKKKWTGCSSSSVANIMNMFLDFIQEYEKMTTPAEEKKIAPVNKKRPVSKTVIQKLQKIAEDFGKVSSKKAPVKKTVPAKKAEVKKVTPVKKAEPKKPVKKAVPVKKLISTLKKKNK